MVFPFGQSHKEKLDDILGTEGMAVSHEQELVKPTEIVFAIDLFTINRINKSCFGALYEVILIKKIKIACRDKLFPRHIDLPK